MGTTLIQHERRVAPADSEVRIAGTAKARKLLGYAAVFDVPSADLGGFTEYLAPGCFRDSLRRNDEVLALVGHGGGIQTLARRSNGSLRLAEDSTGLFSEITLPDTQVGRDVHTLVASGTLRHMSFSFSLPPDSVEWRFDGNGETRIIRKCNLHDVSIVARPAYNQTIVEARNRMQSPRALREKTLGFRSIGHWLQSVYRAGHPEFQPDDETRALSNYGSTTVGADGGFAVPPQFAEAVENKINETSIAGLCDRRQATGGSFHVAADASAPWGSTGLVAEWLGEGGTATQRIPILTLNSLPFYKCLCLAPLSDELLEDAPGLSAFVEVRIAAALAWLLDSKIIAGNGVACPLGMVSAPGSIAVTRNAAGDVQRIDLATMWGRLHRTDATCMAWIVHPETIVKIAAAVPECIPGGTLFGARVLTHQACSALGTKGDVVLGDWSQYLLAVRGPTIASSSHWMYDKGVTAFKGVVRANG